MADRTIAAGSRSQSVEIFIGDSSVTTGAGLTGLVYNSAGLTCYYRKGATGTATAIALVTQTAGGAYATANGVGGGFVAVDGTNAPGQYRLDLPDACFDTPGEVTIHLKGATNMRPVVFKIEVTGDATYSAVTFGVVGTAVKISTNGSSLTTTGFATTGADLIFAVVSSLSASGTPVVSDNFNNNWEHITTRSVNWIKQDVYICTNPRVGASHTFTADLTGSSPSMVVAALSGLRLVDGTDNTSYATGSGTTQQPGSITPSENNCVILQALTTGGTSTATINGGYTTTGVGTNQGGNGIGGSIAYLIQTTATASNPTWTTGNGYNIASGWAFRPRIAGDYVELTQFAHGRIYPVEFGQTYADVPVAGRYIGAEPVEIEIQVTDLATGAIIQGYTAVDGLEVTAGSSQGTWTGTVRIDKGYWISLTPRSHSKTKVLNTGMPTDTQFGVGYIFAKWGQSNGYHWFDAYNPAATLGDYGKQYTAAAGWADPTGNGAIVFVTQMSTALECVVGLVNSCVAGSKLHSENGNGYWLDETASSPYDDALADIDAVVRVHGVLWNQGEADGEDGTSYANYYADLTTLYGRLLAYTGATSDQLFFGVSVLGPLLVGTDATVDAVRRALCDWGNDTDGAFVAYSQIDGVLSDNYHYLSATWYERFANRAAENVLGKMGVAGYVQSAGPEYFRAFRRTGGSTLYLQLTGLGQDGLIENDGTTDGGSLTGFEISNDSFATTYTISATAFNGRFIEFTTSTAMSGTVQIRYAYQQDVGVGKLPLRALLPMDDTIGIPLQPFAAVTVPATTAPDTTEVAAIGTLAKLKNTDVGYTVYDRDGLEYAARSTTGLVILDETNTEATYGAAYTIDDTFQGGYVVFDNGVDTTAVNIDAPSSFNDSANLQTLSQTLLSLLPPGNDETRTWVMRRYASIVGTTKVISKAAAESATFYADVDRLLGANVAVGDVSDISIDTGDSGCTVSGTAVAGNMISFTLTGGTATGANDTVTITFVDSEDSTQVCTAYLLVV